MGDLTEKELPCAQIALLKSVQVEAYLPEIQALRDGKSIPQSSSIAKCTPFVGDDGLLRVKGRLQMSN